VTVIVTEITNNKVYIFGGGVASGVYSLNQRTTLLQLLCQIGQQPQQQQPQIREVPAGPTAAGAVTGARNADLKNAYVLRRGGKIKTNFYDLFINGKINDDIVIEPNDVIFIPALGMEKNVYIVGAVATPRYIVYRDGLTVMEAILEAGGFTKFANENDTVIFRKEGENSITMRSKLNRLIKDGDLTQNIILRPGDYVVVKEGLL
jgi:polysaccharide export outer membrane protein